MSRDVKEVKERMCVCIPGRGKVSVAAQRQEPGSVPGPAKENRGQSGWSGISEGTVTGDEVREVARLGERSGGWAGFVEPVNRAPVWELTSRCLSDFRVLSCVRIQVIHFSMNKGNGCWLWLNPNPFPSKFHALRVLLVCQHRFTGAAGV